MSTNGSNGSNGETVLKKWWDIRQQIKQLEKEEEIIRDKIKNVMISKKLSQLRGKNYRVVYREMSRDTLSKKDCPPEVWSKYSRKITYPMVKIENLGEEIEENEEIQ
jgi:septation ring formation regulator EzrA